MRPGFRQVLVSPGRFHEVPDGRRCRHIGARIPGPCAVDIRGCTIHGQCIVAGRGLYQHQRCQSCNHFDPVAVDQAKAPAPRDADVLPGPVRTIRIDARRISAVSPGGSRYYNCSIFERGDEVLLAVRAGWSGANLHVCTLGQRDWQPRAATAIYPSHALCHAGREDPRLFLHDGRLHVFFAGVQVAGGKTIVHPMVSRLADDLHVEDTWQLEYAHRQHWEKNWQLFSWAGELFAVYSIRPHLVVHLQDGRVAHPFKKIDWKPRWSGGHLRGGAAPVRVGNEFYAFFHGAVDRPGQDPKRVYSIGVYTFQAHPPFAPLRMTPVPLLWPRDDDRPRGLAISVVFPCGAIRRGGDWIVSYGYHDQWCELAWFAGDDIEKALLPCNPCNP